MACSVSNRLYYELLIGIGTTLYGISVVTSRSAMNHGIGPYTFNSLQHVVATSCLILLRPLLKKLTSNTLEYDLEENQTSEQNNVLQWFQKISPRICQHRHFELVFLGIACAIPNFLASSLNQLGLVTVEAGKSAFLTSLYVVFTPLIQYCLHGSSAQLTKFTWMSALISLFGSYLLAGCTQTSFFDTISYGELYTITGAFLWAIGILLTDYAVDRVNCIDLVSLELSISTLFCILLNVVYEPDGLTPLFTFSSPLLTSSLSISWLLIIATGGVEAIAFLLDTIGQIHTSGSRAALLMGLDSVVTVIVAYIFLGEKLTLLESLGCVLLMLSTLLATLGSSDEDEEEEEEEEDEEELEGTEIEIEEGISQVEEDGRELLEKKKTRDLVSSGPLLASITTATTGSGTAGADGGGRAAVMTTSGAITKIKHIKRHEEKQSSPIQSTPFHRLKSTEQFAGELRKQRYVLLLSRRGVPIRRRDRSHTLHDDPRNDKNRQSSDQTSFDSLFNRSRSGSNQTQPPSSVTYLSSSLPPSSSTSFDLLGGISAFLPTNRLKPSSQDDTAINKSTSSTSVKQTEITPLLQRK